MRKCNQCNIEKDESEYEPVSMKGKMFLRGKCRTCVLERRRIRYHSDRDAARKRHAVWYEKQGRENYKKHYAANRDSILEFRRSSRNTPKGRAYHLWKSAWRRSKEGSFDLSRDRLTDIITKGVCQRTGIAFDLSSPINRNVNRFSPSLDRIDRTGGYTDDNTQVVVWCYNTGKGEMSDAEFIEFCKQVALYNA